MDGWMRRRRRGARRGDPLRAEEQGGSGLAAVEFTSPSGPVVPTDKNWSRFGPADMT